MEEEHEALVNMINILCSLLLIEELSIHFLELEGLELLISLCKKQSELRRHIIKVFDYALASHEINCRKSTKHFINVGGLPIIFGFFMLKGEEK